MDRRSRSAIGVPAGAVSRRFVGFTALTVVAAVGSAAALAWTVGWHLGAPGRFWLLALFVLAGEFLPIPVPRRHGLDKVAVSTAFAFAALLVRRGAGGVRCVRRGVGDRGSVRPHRTDQGGLQLRAVRPVAGWRGRRADRRWGCPARRSAHGCGGGDPARRAGVFRDRSRVSGDGRRAAGRPADRALPGRRPRLSTR